MAAIEFNNQKMDAIIREARACGASDIHISEGMQTRYRVHGRLVQAQTQYSADETAELLQSMMNEKPFRKRKRCRLCNPHIGRMPPACQCISPAEKNSSHDPTLKFHDPDAGRTENADHFI